MCRGEGRSGVETCPVVRARGNVDSLRRRPIGGMDGIFEFESNFENQSFRRNFIPPFKNHGFGSLISDFSLHWNLFQRNRTFVNLKSLIISIFDSETEE